MTDTIQVEQMLRKTLEFICADKDRIQIQKSEMSRSVTFTVKSSDRDFARLVGKLGRNHRGLLVLVGLMAARCGKAANFFISSPATRTVPAPSDYTPDQHWSNDWLKAYVFELCAACFENGGTVQVADAGGDVTVVEVTVSDYEELSLAPGITERFPGKTVDEIVAEAFDTVIRAVGKANGREIKTDVQRMNMPVASGNR